MISFKKICETPKITKSILFFHIYIYIHIQNKLCSLQRLALPTLPNMHTCNHIGKHTFTCTPSQSTKFVGGETWGGWKWKKTRTVQMNHPAGTHSGWLTCFKRRFNWNLEGYPTWWPQVNHGLVQWACGSVALTLNVRRGAPLRSRASWNISFPVLTRHIISHECMNIFVNADASLLTSILL